MSPTIRAASNLLTGHERQQISRLISELDHGRALAGRQHVDTESVPGQHSHTPLVAICEQHLDKVSAPSQHSYLPLVVIYLVLCKSSNIWTPFELCRRFWVGWKHMPEDAKSGRASPDAQMLISATLELVHSSYGSLLSLFHSRSPVPAIIDPGNTHTITHVSLSQLISSFVLPPSPHSKPVVAISLPNGPLLATVLLATATFYSAAPIQHGVGVGAEQFKRDLIQSGAQIVLALCSDVERLKLHDPWFRNSHVQILLVDIYGLKFSFRDVGGRLMDQSSWTRPHPNMAGDIAVLLFTSGTSGTKKLVPLHLETLVTGVAMVQQSWGLTRSSRCLNQMPLNHVGGIVRNLFAPVLSGGSVICCGGFDAHAFWDAVDNLAPTWYYASPTMHQCILEAAVDRPQSVAKSQIQLICNAAGGLLPSLASQLKETFSSSERDCTVLPSYGMTECMPISTPPLDYKLDRIGTSGISVGPEIAILDGNDMRMATRRVGRIAVRGAPVFAGYLKEGRLDRSCLTNNGFFDTGDLGYLDADGYLYITGRSKEVINRGGELISPFEVENAILAAARDPASSIHGRVSKALAFSVPHAVLQEVVGLVIVTPAGSRRPCLKTVQEATKSSLASVKVPALLVFMHDDLPTTNNKVLRIRLAERLSIPTLTDATPPEQRYYEATCPPTNTPLSATIQSRLLIPSHDALNLACRSLLSSDTDYHISNKTPIHPILWLAPLSSDSNFASEWPTSAVDQLKKDLLGLDAYLVPSRIMVSKTPLVRDASGEIMEQALLYATAPALPVHVAGNVEAKVIAAFADVLELSVSTLDGTSDFFELGGDSMKAGRLLSAFRKSFPNRITIDVLFNNSTVAALTHIFDIMPSGHDAASLSNEGLVKSLPGCSEVYSSTNPLLMLIQLIPILLVAPMRRALTWSIFVYGLTYSSTLPTMDTLPGRFINLVISLAVGKLVTEICAPLLAIAVKWILIGRYQEGLYPMWSLYHTRWWFVQKVLSVGGLGVYEFSNATRVMYHRLLGAQIGRNVFIDRDAKLGEHDLISIGHDVVLDACHIRPFAVERNTSMYLGRIRIGSGASIGQASLVAAGTEVPVDACIGANSSSWELDDATEANRLLSPAKSPGPHWLLHVFLTYPLMLLAYFIGAIPWFGGLLPLVITEPKHDAQDIFREVIIWFASPQRVVFHYVALGCRAVLGPIFFFVAVLAMKKTFDACCGGPIQPGPAKTRSQMDRFRMEFMRTVMTDRQFHALTNLFGTHYSMTSFFARLLGAKVGEKVYWPGKGPTIQDFDMLDVGDSVVFGSRSSIITSDGLGTKTVRIGGGSMVADRVILRPGTYLGESTVMGTGALTRRNKYYPANTTWVGSKRNDAICLTSDSKTAAHAVPRYERYRHSVDAHTLWEDKIGKNIQVMETVWDSRTSSISEHKSYMTDVKLHTPSVPSTSEGPKHSSPFGRAFYEGKAPYRVWSQTTVALYSTFIIMFTAVFWNIHSIGAIQVVAWIYRQSQYHLGFLRDRDVRPLFIYAFFTAVISAIMAVEILVVIGVVIASKWALLGRRQQGNFDWDQSSYCQRWQLLLKIESLRGKCYGGHGILGMITGTRWIVLYFQALGLKAGKDCALFASGTPSLYMTEPDLVTLGDRVSIDDASLVCHINTRGKFDLNPLVVGDRSVLRAGSRLLSGARMEADSCLLEHTLVMAGDVVDAETTIQGWPGSEFNGNRLPTMKIAYHWETTT